MRTVSHSRSVFRLAFLSVALATAAWLSACGSESTADSGSGAQNCTSGVQESCSCGGSSQGKKLCANGTFGACECGIGDAGSDAGLFEADASSDLAQAEVTADILVDSSPDSSADAPADVVDAGITPLCPGAAGCPCKGNADCQTGLCIEDSNFPGGKACAAKCLGDCPSGYTCANTSGTSGDIVSLCVPKFEHLCDPCSTSKDCSSLGILDSACTDQGSLGRFCGSTCTKDTDCPADYSCQEATSVEGKKLKQCLRKSKGQEAYGTCPCSPGAAANKLTTVCFAEQKDASGQVTGNCAGVRTCSAAGLSDCIAPAAKPEFCNGLDDDCDGQTDEATCEDNNLCTTDSCNANSGCVHAPNQLACDDGSVCTAGDFCKDAACLPGKTYPCNDGNPCTSDSCDKTSGCVFLANSATCSDGNACTLNDACSGAACSPGSPLDCDDGLPCSLDTCDFKIGCGHSDNSSPCDDGSVCTVGDVCASGACKPGSTVGCDDGNPCTDDACNAKTGCQHSNNTASCNDNNLCTAKEVCKAGVCTPLTASSCDDGNPCTTESCDPALGCQSTDNTAPCSDGSVCTVGDSCSGGKCQSGNKVSCNDGNPCTDDTCYSASGCSNVANSGPCSDGNLCTATDACEGGICTPGQAKNCSDGNACTDDSCDPKSGCTVANNSAPCSDGSVCTSGDTCNGGACKSGTLQICTDGNVCTTDSCDAVKGCLATNNIADCEDNDVCTANDQCAGGKCAGTLVACNDNNPCTTDSCNAGCKYANAADDTSCGSNQVCKAGVCSNKPTQTTINTLNYKGMTGYPLDFEACKCCNGTTTKQQMDAFCKLAGFSSSVSFQTQTLPITTCYCWGACSNNAWYSNCCSGAQTQKMVTSVTCQG